MTKVRRQLVLFATAGILAAMFSAFESRFWTGALGVLQVIMLPLAIFPFVIGAVMGGNAHTSGQLGFFIGAFVECYVAVNFMWGRNNRKNISPK